MTDHRKDLALDMIQTPEFYQAFELVAVLEDADDLYANDGESFIEDNEYDALYIITKRIDPANEYFTGVGSEVRGGKVELPFEMGSLDQVEIGDIVEWVRKNNLEDEEIAATDKMDGTSALVVYGTSGRQQIAYSRGNGTEGADISRHLFKIKGVPQTVSRPMTIRAEVELTETAFAKLRELVKKSDGSKYKNARNMVAGIMNSSKRPAVVYDYLTVIAYQIVGEDDISKTEMLDELKAEGFQVEDYSTFYGRELSDKMLAVYLTKRKEATDYAIDGLVLDVVDVDKRHEMDPTRDTLNPAYSIKYKVADASNMAIATVIGVEWNISKHGYLKPRVCIEPTELVGVTVKHATGFNARFIKDNGIGVGAKVRITRSGDVIPFILECVEPSIPAMPMEFDLDWSWNETGVDAVLNENTSEVAIQQVLDFCMSIEAPHLKEGAVRELFKTQKYTATTEALVGMLSMDKRTWVGIMGANGTKIYNGLQSKIADMPMHVLLGSTSYFGRGVGKRKFKKLVAGLQMQSINEMTAINKAQIISLDDFEDKTASKIVAGVGPFMEFYDQIAHVVNIQEIKSVNTGVDFDGQKICMTGFRDKDMTAFIENSGGLVQSAASSKTTMVVAKDPNSTSGKIKKARDLGIEIIGMVDFKAKYMGASEAPKVSRAPKKKDDNLLEF